MEFKKELLLLILMNSFHNTSSVEICEDNSDYVSKCPNWQTLCSEDSNYRPFMEKNCPKTCGICTEECKDSDDYANSCYGYREQGYCEPTNEYHNTMKKLCSKTCGFCSVDNSVSTCADDQKYAPRCHSFLAQGLCRVGQPYYESMKKFCPKTCNLCDESGGQTCANGPASLGRVVGGEEAKPNSWPWQVGLLYNSKFDCGGTLIGIHWVLTAAHCVVGREIKLMKAVLGEHDWTKVSGKEQFINIIEIIKYTDYNLLDNLDDIALLKLETPARITKEVQIACLPNKNEETNGQCFLTGWGYTSPFSSETSNTLQEVELPIATREDCERLNFRVGSGRKLGAGQMCAGYGADYDNIQTGCRGDSGGPLACRYGIRWTVDGVVSSGSSKCLGFEKYTVFTKVNYYKDWIDQTMQNN